MNLIFIFFALILLRNCYF